MQLLRKTFAGSMLTLVLIGALTLAFNIQPVKASGTVYIRADGSIDPPDAPISTVDYVTYTLTGNITSDADGIVVERSNIIIDGNGYTLQGDGTGSGFSLSSINKVTIKNTNTKDFNYGVYLKSVSNNTISGNNITANNWCGILLCDSSSNTIYGNAFFNDGLSVSESYKNVVLDNSVNGKPLVYLEGASDRVVHDAGQAILVNCNNITVENLELPSTSIGVELWGTNNTRIARNNVTKSYCGIGLGGSSYNNTIYRNNIINNEYGIQLDGSSNNSIGGNNITANNWCGIDLCGSSYNTVSGNNITKSYWGISFGIGLGGSSYNNTIYRNNITNNEYGIWLCSYYKNKFYHNSFIDNTQQVHIEASGYANFWDDGYPCGGNYWSNYTGVDLYSGPNQDYPSGSDGIGDSAYIIDENNRDRYPLAAPISVFNAGTWNGVAYNVDVVSNSTLSDFYFNPDEGAFVRFWVSGETETETFGFCRVAIPKDLLWVEDGWTVLKGSYPLSYETLSDENYTYLYFVYQNPYIGVKSVISIYGTHVIPEFPSAIIQPLFIVLSIIAVFFAKKRLPRRLKP